MSNRLKVLPRGGVMVPRFESILSGGKEFVGRRWSDAHGPGGGWEPLADPVVVPSVPESDAAFHELRAEYAREVREGALWAADAETAAACGVKFDPNFGGEFAASTSRADSAAEPSLSPAPHDEPAATNQHGD